MFEQKKLSKEDQDRVDRYLQNGFNKSERGRLLGVLWVVVSALGFISWYIGKQAGYL
jgi:hypothetical protein